MDDHELLRRYAQDRSQDAFRELVDRHLGMAMVQPMVKIGNEWKLGGSTTGHEDAWDQNGQIRTFDP